MYTFSPCWSCWFRKTFTVDIHCSFCFFFFNQFREGCLRNQVIYSSDIASRSTQLIQLFHKYVFCADLLWAFFHCRGWLITQLQVTKFYLLWIVLIDMEYIEVRGTAWFSKQSFLRNRTPELCRNKTISGTLHQFPEFTTSFLNNLKNQYGFFKVFMKCYKETLINVTSVLSKKNMTQLIGSKINTMVLLQLVSKIAGLCANNILCI